VGARKRGWGFQGMGVAAVALGLATLACVSGQLLPEGEVLGGRYHREILFPRNQIVVLRDAPARSGQVEVLFYYNRPDSYLPEAFICRRRSPFSSTLHILAVLRDKNAKLDAKRDAAYDIELDGRNPARTAGFSYQRGADGGYETQTGLDKAGQPLNGELYCLQPRWKTPLLMGVYAKSGALMYAVSKLDLDADTGFEKVEEVPLSQRIFYYQDLPDSVFRGSDGDLDTRSFGLPLYVFAGNLADSVFMRLRARYPG
jgi:hypothetical protein